MTKDTENNNNATPSDECCAEDNFIKNGKVYIFGAFDKSISRNIVPELITMTERLKNVKDANIDIFINSHGGGAEDLLGLLSVISMAKSCGIKITTYNMGVAYSCGSILFIHGDVRKMYRCATNVMHLGWASGNWTTFEQLDRVTENNKKWFNTIVNWYVERTKMSKKEVIGILKDDKFCLDAEQCLKYGFCDEII